MKENEECPVCPKCGLDLGPDDLDIDEQAGITRFECPRCGETGAWLT